MIYKIYSIFDAKVEAYLAPIFLRSHGEAIRSFEGAALDEKSQFHRNAEDYTLFHLGEFDDSTALFQMEMIPVPLAKAHEVLARQASAA
ncbi:MAG: nonstructural protein [Microviridae sp.]|nr:MAG: nonstructural protein [Microviridae sp.]